mmetsp:Transcript_17866/g.20466  ORF Transcript_17866/g.20466 Transcript_17866/m.20466 type:complete len:84 (+) Transcript_17866:73-324(+)
MTPTGVSLPSTIWVLFSFDVDVAVDVDDDDDIDDDVDDDIDDDRCGDDDKKKQSTTLLLIDSSVFLLKTRTVNDFVVFFVSVM